MAYTTIDDPTAYFQTTLYTGTGSSQAITNTGNSDLQPDFVWIKNRDGTRDHYVYDSVRGVNKNLFPNLTNAESTDDNDLMSYDTDGFTLGGEAGVGASGETFASWQWKETATAGFDIVAYTGNGSARTISHSLSAVPNVMIAKGRSKVDGWFVYHHKNTSAPETDFIRLDSTDATTDNGNVWNDTAPTSSVFTVGIDNGVNENTETYIAYLFAEKKGYTKFGSYTGNGSSSGPMIFTGFKPAWVMLKLTSADNENWVLMDNKRNPFNTTTKQRLRANTNAAEATSGSEIDLLSNGFKVHDNDAEINSSGATYIYMAFAESPFVTSTGIPTTAR